MRRGAARVVRVEQRLDRALAGEAAGDRGGDALARHIRQLLVEKLRRHGAALARQAAAANRVRSDENSDGIIPGEGAAFITLVAADDSTAYAQAGDQAAMRISAVATGVEPYPFSRRSLPPSQPGEGLTEVFGALSHEATVMELRAERLLSCQSGERYFADEFTSAYLRNGPLLPEPLVAHRITQSLGDVGASAGLITLAFGAHLLTHTPLCTGSGHRALLYGSSDHGLVGALVLEVFGAIDQDVTDL